jgi:hypothetical protein
MFRYTIVLTLVMLSASCARATHEQPVSNPPVAVEPEKKPTETKPEDNPAPPPVPEEKPAEAKPPSQPVAPALPKPTTATPKPAVKPATPAPPKTARASSQPPVKPAVPVAPAAPVARTLDVNTLIEQLKETKAIGLFTKISLKNKVDDLMDKFHEYYQRQGSHTLPELRQSYDLLMMKVLSLLQDKDPPLATTIASSREAIWGLLSDQKKFEALPSE